jgi:hypothetical protein
MNSCGERKNQKIKYWFGSGGNCWNVFVTYDKRGCILNWLSKEDCKKL